MSSVHRERVLEDRLDAVASAKPELVGLLNSSTDVSDSVDGFRKAFV